MAPRLPVRTLSGLREVSHLYRAFLFEYATLCGDSSVGIAPAPSIRCVHELLKRGKRVGIVEGTPRRASVVTSAARSRGVPVGVNAWSSGEHIHRCLSPPHSNARRQQLPSPFHGPDPIKVFGLSAIAVPRSWSTWQRREPSVIKLLSKNHVVKAADEIIEGVVCFWDAIDDDNLDDSLDAIMELCAAHTVPFVHAHSGAAAMRCLKAAHAASCGTPQAAAHHVRRLGGKSFGISALEGCAEGLGWSNLTPRDILVVSSKLEDVADADKHGMDVALVLGNTAKGQVQAFAEAKRLKDIAKRQQMSMSQRVEADSPGMMHAATSPFLSFLKLPQLLRDVSRQNKEDQERETAMVAAAQSASKIPSGRALLSWGVLEQLEAWCGSSQIGKPAGTFLGSLSWDAEEVVPPTDMSESSVALEQDVKTTPRATPTDPSRSFHCEDTFLSLRKEKVEEVETMDDILAQLNKVRGEK